MGNEVLILGIGGAGGNIINAIHRDSKNSTLRNARYIYADTDDLALRIYKMNFGKGIETLALNSDEEVFPAEVLCDVKRLFIVVGLGGKTGSCFAGNILEKAKEMNIHVSVFATIPFGFESKRKFAKEIAEQLETTQSYYAKYEAGIREIPIWRLIKIADIYNVNLDWICGRTTKRNINY